MLENKELSEVLLSIDVKKSRIRVHKTTLHQLGDPLYIQLLVNPSAMAVAIRCIDMPLSKDALHKVTRQTLQSENSYEIYSHSFIHELMRVVPQMRTYDTYRVKGVILEGERTAVFSLKTLHKVRTEMNDEQPKTETKD